MLGLMYKEGRGGLAKDDAQAVSLFRKAAEQGFAQAQFTLGWAYDTGDGVPVDIIEGERWLRKAADQGYDLAQYVLCLKHNEFCNN
jgi:TPR repeat protein